MRWALFAVVDMLSQMLACGDEYICHCPVCSGEIGVITRPGRPIKSSACGALHKVLIELKAEGYSKNCKVSGCAWGCMHM